MGHMDCLHVFSIDLRPDNMAMLPRDTVLVWFHMKGDNVLLASEENDAMFLQLRYGNRPKSSLIKTAPLKWVFFPHRVRNAYRVC